MKFFTGVHHPSIAQHLGASFVSINALRDRKGDFTVGDWVMDSGAFTRITTHGFWEDDEHEYAAQIRRWSKCGNLLAAVSRDYMCEDFALQKSGLTIRDHQNMTIGRYERLLGEDCGGVYIMPVLQGRSHSDYIQHIKMYEERGHLPHGAWVGVGSVCKRNADPMSIFMCLSIIKDYRPDLKLHGFGVKLTSLAWAPIRELLETADSMAWSFAARKQGRDQNSHLEAMKFAARIQQLDAAHASIDVEGVAA